MDLRTVIYIVALAGLALVMYERLRRRHPADYRARLGRLSATNLIVSMQRRRKRAIAVAAPLGAVALALLFVARYTYPAGVRIWGFDGALLLLGAILFGTALTTLLWGYRCPVCGQALATIGGLILGTEGCPICASWPPGSSTAVASATRAGQGAGERRPRAGALRRVHLLVEGDRLILVKARFPRLVDLVPLLGFFGLWYLFLWRQAAGAQSTFVALLIGLFGLALVVVMFDRHLPDTLRTLAKGTRSSSTGPPGAWCVTARRSAR